MCIPSTPEGAVVIMQALLDLGESTELCGEGDNMMTKLTDYVLTAEAAETLGVSQNTLRAWAKAGKIPVNRNPANGYRLFRRADLADFLHMAAQPARPFQSEAR